MMYDTANGNDYVLPTLNGLRSASLVAFHNSAIFLITSVMGIPGLPSADALVCVVWLRYGRLLGAQVSWVHSQGPEWHYNIREV